jgi:hypothetical protein
LGVSVSVFKIAILLVWWLGITLGCTSRGAAAGSNRELLEKSGAAGWKLIGNPAKLVTIQLL